MINDNQQVNPFIPWQWWQTMAPNWFWTPWILDRLKWIFN
jgi:hypothetical protein